MREFYKALKNKTLIFFETHFQKIRTFTRYLKNDFSADIIGNLSKEKGSAFTKKNNENLFTVTLQLRQTNCYVCSCFYGIPVPNGTMGSSLCATNLDVYYRSYFVEEALKP